MIVRNTELGIEAKATFVRSSQLTTVKPHNSRQFEIAENPCDETELSATSRRRGVVFLGVGGLCWRCQDLRHACQRLIVPSCPGAARQPEDLPRTRALNGPGSATMRISKEHGEHGQRAHALL